MEPLLFLAHRIPYPPNKGDKITNFEMLKYFSKRYEVHLGTFIDDPRDRVHRDEVLKYCGSAHFENLNPRLRRLMSAPALAGRRALTLAYYPRRNLLSWCERTVRERGIKRVFVSSTPMYQFVPPAAANAACVIQYHDLDSDKWRQYAETTPWPMSAIYRRESVALLEYERAIARQVDAGFFVTPSEAALFRELAPESAHKIHWPGHGVDHEYYRSTPDRENPFPPGTKAVLFVGVLDYWPNEDAAIWYAREIHSRVRQTAGDVRFYVVGMNPTPRVRELGTLPGVVVTGEVPDVRPWFQHASVVVAPLRIARGIQNKVLQAMAIGRPVVMSRMLDVLVVCAPGRGSRSGYDGGRIRRDRHQDAARFRGGRIDGPAGARADPARLLLASGRWNAWTRCCASRLRRVASRPETQRATGRRRSAWMTPPRRTRAHENLEHETAAMHILIVKHGALGDVVRTSYFATPLRRKWGADLRLSWVTAPVSLPLLRFHPALDDLWTSFEEARGHRFDRIYSLDDEPDVLQGVGLLDCTRLTGAYFDSDGARRYTDDAAEWFDMGLLSRHGKARADELKKLNTRSHAQIHARIFEVENAVPEFHGDPAMEKWACTWLGEERPVVGINPFAGGRWPSKELPARELRTLVSALLDGGTRFGPRCRVVLVGAGADRARNAALAEEFGSQRLRVADTDDSLVRLAGIVGRLDHLVSSDSLAMHLGIAQGVPTTAFFAPTSAVEIDDFGRVWKVASTSPDYCSYRADADNSTITAQRLLASLQ